MTSPSRHASLVRGNALALPLADASVDLVVTSPPYFALRSYQDGGEHYDGQIGSEATPQAFLEALWAVTAECARVLKPSGSMFVNLGDKYSQRVATRPSSHQDGLFPGRPELRKDWKRDRERGLARMPSQNLIETEHGHHAIREKSLMGLPWRYAIGCTDRLGLVLRAEIVWDKPNGMPESVKDRVRRSHEQWFHLTKRATYYADVRPIREPHSDWSIKRALPHRAQAGRAMREGVTYEGTDLKPHSFKVEQMVHPDGKLPGSVWTVATEPLVVPEDLPQHYAAFPTEWPRRFILGWSPPGGVVLDPMTGTGTVPMVARALGRYGVGVDLSADYLRLAKWRVFKSGHGRKAVTRTDQEAQQEMAL